MNTCRKKSCFHPFPAAIAFDAMAILEGDNTVGANLFADAAANAAIFIHKDDAVILPGDRSCRAGFQTFSAMGAADRDISKGFFPENYITKGIFTLLRTDVPLIHTSHLAGLTTGAFGFIKFDHGSDLLFNSAADAAIAGEAGIGIPMVVGEKTVCIRLAVAVI